MAILFLLNMPNYSIYNSPALPISLLQSNLIRSTILLQTTRTLNQDDKICRNARRLKFFLFPRILPRSQRKSSSSASSAFERRPPLRPRAQDSSASRLRRRSRYRHASLANSGQKKNITSPATIRSFQKLNLMKSAGMAEPIAERIRGCSSRNRRIRESSSGPFPRSQPSA